MIEILLSTSKQS